MKKKIVIALGGNALGQTPNEQKELVKKTAQQIVELVELGYKIIITHGNGPQVGMINLAFENSHTSNQTIEMPFPECGAMSEGYIGYHLQAAIQNELNKKKLPISCVTLVTQVEVDPKDPAFQTPTKPIGAFYTKEVAEEISKDKNYIFKEDAGRGYRRVVPSPEPQKVLELNIIKKLVEGKDIIIACGGGGIPVINTKEGYIGVDAVIDKDMTSALLASDLKANTLLILTSVEYVYLNYNKPNQSIIHELSIAEIAKYTNNDEFAAGSMLPKIKACSMFIKNNSKGQAIITSLTSAKKALQGKTGTIIKKDRRKEVWKK